MSMLKVEGLVIDGHEVTGILSPDKIVDYCDEENENGYVCEFCDSQDEESRPMYHSLSIHKGSVRLERNIEYYSVVGTWRSGGKGRHAICASCLAKIYNHIGVKVPSAHKAPTPVVYEVLWEDNFSGISIKKCLFIDRESVIEYISKKIPTTTKDGQTSRFTVNVYEVGEPDEG